VPSSISPTLRIIRGANRTLGRVAPAVAARLNQRLFSTPRRFDPRPWEAAFEVSGTRHRVAGGISVLTAGDGPVVALVHGWEGRATQFAGLAAPLVAAGYRVVAMDGPAHGHSRGRVADPLRFADALQEVAGAFGPLYGAVGHSMGGASIALAIGNGLEVERAVLIASPASLHEVLQRFASAMQLPPSAIAHFVHGIRREVVRRGHRDIDLLAVMATLTVPALVVHAHDDREVPFTDGERIASHWPGARLAAVHDVGHRRVLRAPAVIDAATAFLGDQRSAIT
jgi:pimeloyl-ACP methyl ester carboxylesterase